MARRSGILFGMDLGTSSSTVNHCGVRDTFDSTGNMSRRRLGKILEVKDWPRGNKFDGTGNMCFPTDLVYLIETKELLYCGFEAKEYLDDPDPEIKVELVFHVQNIKLLIANSNDVKASTPASERYLAQRNNLIQVLGKQPEDAFEDFMDYFCLHSLENADRHYAAPRLGNERIELILAFPSGWPDRVHTKVAEIGARSMKRAIQAHDLQNMYFGTEDVYTVSETLCGVKEWLKDTITETSDMDEGGNYLSVLNEGDLIAACDVGAGTGCLTVLELVSKAPLQVDQLSATESLEVSGEVIEAEFENWIKQWITKDDYPGDIQHLIRVLCRKFKDEKKDCGRSLRSASTTWNFAVPGLQANQDKLFETGRLKIKRTRLDACFDPAIDILQAKLTEIVQNYPRIKTIVFLGQLGGSSHYLKERMANSSVAKRVRVVHSLSGKLNVVKGAIGERFDLNNPFIRKYKTRKSYGTLISMQWYTGSVAQRMFPYAKRDGAVDFERGNGERWLKVIEWAIPKETILQNGTCENIGMDGKRYHTWQSKDKIKFQDIIVVSEEAPPPPQFEGMAYTVWTKAHDNNELWIAGERVHVQKISFDWNLSMSQKLDSNGNLIGPYDLNDLSQHWELKGKRRSRYRKLEYEPVWNITEMQVKLYIRPLFPNPIGALTTQLAMQGYSQREDVFSCGESRSIALEKDIEIEAGVTSASASSKQPEEPVQSNKEPSDALLIVSRHDGVQPGNDLEGDYRESTQQSLVLPLTPHNTSMPIASTHSKLPQSGFLLARPPVQASRQPLVPRSRTSYKGISRIAAGPQRRFIFPRPDKQDGRRRPGCWSCKDRSKRCLSDYTMNADNLPTCGECLKLGITCHMSQPQLDPEQLDLQRQERKNAIKSGKRKTRDESEPSGRESRARSSTLTHDSYNFSPYVQQSVEKPSVYDDYGSDGPEDDQIKIAAPPRRGKFFAIRGGKKGSRDARH